MQWQHNTRLFLTIDHMSLEARCWGPPPDQAPCIVLLHEGLGCVDLWRDFPEQLAQKTGHGVFAYSRLGYGASDPVTLPRPLDYMQREAMDVLPKVLDAIGLQTGVLLGHSDGASIAAYYAGSIADRRLRGLCLIAPHFFTEPVGLAAIAAAKSAYESGDLRQRLAKYHQDVDGAFRGWCDAWLDPAFKDWDIQEALPYIRVPVLALQGDADPYGSPAQLLALQEQLYAPLSLTFLQGCGHAPHSESLEATVALVADFLKLYG